MDWLRGLFKQTPSQARPTTIYLVARMTQDGATAVAAFLEPEAAGRLLVNEHRRRIGRSRRSGASLTSKEVEAAYRFLNDQRRPGEFWSALPVEIAPGGDAPLPDFWHVLLDFEALGSDDDPVTQLVLPGFDDPDSDDEGDEDDQLAGAATPRPDSAAEEVAPVYMAAEWLDEFEVSCVVFDEVAAAKRFTLAWHNVEEAEAGREATEDFRVAFLGLNRPGDEAAYSLCAIPLGRDRLIPILNGRASARAANVGRGVCDLPDIRIGRALPLDA
jgi:hypothetical protein